MTNIIQFIVALVATAFLAYVVIKNVKKGEFLNYANMFCLFAAADIFLPAMIGAVTGKYLTLHYFAQIDEKTYFMATVIFAISLVLFVLGWKSKDLIKINPKRKGIDTGYTVSEGAMLISFFGALGINFLNIVREFIACGSWENFYKFKITREYLATVENNSIIDKIISLLSEFDNPVMLIVVSIGIVNCARLKHKIIWTRIAPLITLALSFTSLYRGSILTWFMMIMLSLQFKNAEKKESERKRFNRAIIILGGSAVAVFVGFGVVRALLQSAHYGNENSAFSALITTVTQTIGASLSGLARCLNYLKSGNPIVWGKTIFEMAYAFIPRAILPTKPSLYGIVSITTAMGSPDTTMDAVSIPGELIVNFGIAGLLLVPVIGFIFRCFEDFGKSPRFKYLSAVLISFLVTTSMWMSFTGFLSRIKLLPIYVLVLVFIIRKNNITSAREMDVSAGEKE